MPSQSHDPDKLITALQVFNAGLVGVIFVGLCALFFINRRRRDEDGVTSQALSGVIAPLLFGTALWSFEMFLAAVGLALVERSPLNAFATWRRVASLATYLPRLPRGPAPTAGPPAGGNVGVVP